MKQYSSSLLNTIKIGYVIIPKNQDGVKRDLFVKDCIRRGRVTILMEEGQGVAHNCPVSKPCIGGLEFPQEFGKTGSCVLLFVDPMHSLPIVFATLNKVDDINILNEGQSRLISENGDNTSEVSVSKDATININVSGDEDNGSVNINVVNKNRTGKLNIKVIGESNIYSSDKVTVTSDTEIEAKVQNIDNDTESYFKIIKGEGISYKDEFGNSLETNSDEETIFNENIKDSFIADLNAIVSKMNMIENKVNQLVSFSASHVHPGVTTGAGSTLVTVSPVTGSLTNTTKDDLKDERIKN